MQKIARIAATDEAKVPDARVWRKIDSSGWTREATTLPLPRITKREGKQSTCHLTVSADMIRARRVNILHDGGSWIALEPDDAGTYVVGMNGLSRRIVTIPTKLQHMIPNGHHAVNIIPQDGLFLINIGAIGD